MNKLLPNTIHWSKDLASITNESSDQAKGVENKEVVKAVDAMGRNDVRVSFNDGVSIDCALVIGADGIRSKTRSILEPDNDPIYTGVFIVLGITSYKHPLLHQGGFYTLVGSSTYTICLV